MHSLCAEGYTCLWYFRNQLAPRNWIGYGLSPLHGRVTSLFEQLPEKTGNYIFGVNNLCNSPKFAKQAFNDIGKDVMTHGVCRQSRGIPKLIVQDAVTRKKELLRHRGNLKASVITGEPKCKDLVVVSLYNTKLVYLLSNIW